MIPSKLMLDLLKIRWHSNLTTHVHLISILKFFSHIRRSSSAGVLPVCYKNVDVQVSEQCKDIDAAVLAKKQKTTFLNTCKSMTVWTNSICCARSWDLLKSSTAAILACTAYFLLAMHDVFFILFQLIKFWVSCRSQPHVAVPDASPGSQPLHLVLWGRDTSVWPERGIFHLLLPRPRRPHVDLLVWNPGTAWS